MSNAITVTADENDLNVDKIVEAITVIQNIVVVDKSELKYFNKTQCIMNDEKSLNYEEKGSFESVSATIFMLSLIMAICLAIFVYNSVSLSFIRKINVFGTMRCIGLSNKKLIWLILSEQFILVSSGAFCGMACGALLNLAIAEKIMSALFSTSAVMEIDQSIKTYVVTYLLTLISAFFACLKLILKIRKTNPININIFNTVVAVNAICECANVNVNFIRDFMGRHGKSGDIIILMGNFGGILHNKCDPIIIEGNLSI